MSWNVVSVVIVGATALLGSGGEEGGSTNATASETFLGVCLMMAGAFVQALQFVFEEHVMKMDVPAPPLLLIGMEGKFVGVLIRDHGGCFTLGLNVLILTAHLQVSGEQC